MATDKELEIDLRRKNDWERLVRLEARMDTHEIELNEMMTMVKDLGSSLTKVNNTLLQIKYTAFGAIALILMQYYGIAGFLLKLFTTTA